MRKSGVHTHWAVDLTGTGELALTGSAAKSADIEPSIISTTTTEWSVS